MDVKLGTELNPKRAALFFWQLKFVIPRSTLSCIHSNRFGCRRKCIASKSKVEADNLYNNVQDAIVTLWNMCQWMMSLRKSEFRHWCTYAHMNTYEKNLLIGL